SVWFFKNTGSADQPVLAKGVKIKAGGKVIIKNTGYENSVRIGTYSKLHFGDYNGDDLRDLLIGNTDKLLVYKNIGSINEPVFAAPFELKNIGGGFPDRPSPYVFDWDEDGVDDLLVGTDRGEVFFYKNTGTNEMQRLASGKKVKLDFDYEQIPMRHRFDIVDWNNDGILDIVMGEFHSKINNGKRSTNGNVWLFLGKN
ncbi:MAG: VCBS repeat-containing protein, partial [bacterium]|nr:VCBS repeat-containing protein [bacterium]